MQVEICVQSYLEDSAELEGGKQPLDPSRPPFSSISVETWEVWFQTWLELLQPDLSPIQAYELSLRLTDDREIQSLNHQYRHQNKPTDVLAFAALEAESPSSDEVLSSLPFIWGHRDFARNSFPTG